MKKVIIITILLLFPIITFCATNSQATTGNEETGFFYWFSLGGEFMFVLLLFSVAGIAIVIERIITISKTKLTDKKFEKILLATADKGQIRKLKTICEANDSETAKILLSGINMLKRGPERMEKVIESAAQIRVSILERGLSLLSGIANLAPLVGFLGTVSGMISAFSVIANTENVSAKLVAGGIFKALITTAAGLIVAIPILIFYNYFTHRIEKFAMNIEELSLGVIEKLEKNGKL